MTNKTVNFIRSLYGSDDFIPLHIPNLGEKEKEHVNRCLDSTFVSSVGPYVNGFEALIAEVAQTDYGVAVVNGTAALQVALRLAGVSKGTEVITQSLTFVATANAIAYNNATPIFLDVDKDTMGLSPKAVAEFLDEFAETRDGKCYNKSTGKQITACVPMHTFGFPVHMDELKAVCGSYFIPIVEDAAESLGSLYKGRPTGGLGDLGTFSFNGNKIVTCGGGGAIVTNHERLALKGKHLTTTAKQPHAYEYYHDELGYNYRMPNLNAALAVAQMERLDHFIEKKREIASLYASFFAEIGVKFRTELPGTKANYWLMCIELESKEERDDFLKITNKSGVMTRPIWQLMHRLPMYANCQRDKQQNAVFLEERIVNIPSYVK